MYEISHKCTKKNNIAICCSSKIDLGAQHQYLWRKKYCVLRYCCGTIMAVCRAMTISKKAM